MQDGRKFFVTKLLQDGLEFPNTIIQEELRYFEEILYIFKNLSALRTFLVGERGGWARRKFFVAEFL